MLFSTRHIFYNNSNNSKYVFQLFVAVKQNNRETLSLWQIKAQNFLTNP